MKNKFTKGPWVAERHSNERYSISGNNGQSVAWTQAVSYKHPEHEEANASLITKAPELYDTVDEMVDAMRKIISGKPCKNLDEIMLKAEVTLKEIDSE